MTTFDFGKFEEMFAHAESASVDAQPTFTQSEIEKMNMDHIKNGAFTLNVSKRTQTRITDERELSQFAGPRRGNRARPKLRKNYCEACDAPMEKDQLDNGVTGYVCHGCGKQGDYCYDSIVDDVDRTSTGNDASTYNTYSSASAPLTITGPGGHIQRRGIIGGNASYKKAQEKTTRKEFQQILSSSEIGQQIPPEVRREAEDLFLSIQGQKILRASHRTGTMAACLDVKCAAHMIPRKCKEISEMFGIMRSTLSAGHSTLNKLIERGLIDEQIKPVTTSRSHGKDSPEIVGYINRYFEGLDIPLDDGYGIYEGADAAHIEEIMEIMEDEDRDNTEWHPNYKRFALDLIRFTQTFKIADTSMDSSKCAGIIYILSTRIPELDILPEHIERECNISKSTFLKFANEIDRFLNTYDPDSQKTKRKMRHLFKKYDIPLKHTL
jgi:hypothetical protein